jgi:hypothetical protein
MGRASGTMSGIAKVSFLVAAVSLLTPGAQSQGGRGGVPPPAKTPKETAPFDIAGYWEALITRDWRFRMLNPPKGDYLGLPLNAEGRKAADMWDPAKDEAAGEQCKAYGAVNIMRMPGRIHISWADDQTLKVETDAGIQTRMFYFGTPQSKSGDWQGVSQAAWDTLAGVPRVPGQANAPPTPTGALKVVTRQMKAGYLRRNGVPYSANAVLTEYYDQVKEPNGDSLLIITTTLDDPAYLTQPYLTSQNFKKQGGAAGWNPTPCWVR